MFENPAEQQVMLEMSSAGERLRKYSQILGDSLNFLSAASAVKSALGENAGAQGGEAGGGGPGAQAGGGAGGVAESSDAARPPPGGPD